MAEDIKIEQIGYDTPLHKALEQRMRKVVQQIQEEDKIKVSALFLMLVDSDGYIVPGLVSFDADATAMIPSLLDRTAAEIRRRKAN